MNFQENGRNRQSLLPHWLLPSPFPGQRPDFPTNAVGVSESMAVENLRIPPAHPSYLKNCFYFLSLWVSLPLAIWLSSGWIGLLSHWQAIAGKVCWLECTAQPLSAQHFSRMIDAAETLEGKSEC